MFSFFNQHLQQGLLSSYDDTQDSLNKILEGIEENIVKKTKKLKILQKRLDLVNNRIMIASIRDHDVFMDKDLRVKVQYWQGLMPRLLKDRTDVEHEISLITLTLESLVAQKAKIETDIQKSFEAPVDPIIEKRVNIYSKGYQEDIENYFQLKADQEVVNDTASDVQKYSSSLMIS